MKAYITAVAAAAIMAAFSDNLVPVKWQKYAGLLTGAVLLLTLISPLIKLRNIDIPHIGELDSSVVEYDIAYEVEEELKKRIEADIESRIEEEFDVNIIAEVKLNIKEDKIQGVERITLSNSKDARIEQRLNEVYGCSNIQWRGK